MRKFYLSPIAASLALTFSSAYAAIPIPLQRTSFVDVQHRFHLVLPHAAKSAVASQMADTLQFIQQHTDQNNVTHVRMQQQYAGFPVFGGYAIFHHHKGDNGLLSASNDVKMNGVIYRDLKSDIGQPPANFATHANGALHALKATYDSHLITEEQATPMVYVDDKNQAFWAYKVSFLVTYDDKIPERLTAIVDARTLKIYQQWNDMKTIRSSVKGRGFGGNQHEGEYQYGTDLPLLSITRNNAAAICYMENKEVKVVDMAHKYAGPNITMKFNCKDSDPQSENTFWVGYQNDGYDLINGAYSPSNDALYAGQMINDMYKQWYGLNVLTVQDKPLQLIMRVHFGKGYENAYWDHMQMTFGDGDATMHPLVSLGIGAHEISHGFTEQHSDLDYFAQSGGINEAFSDMAAQAAEFYAYGKNSWEIGAEIMKDDSGYKALRFMDQPSRDGRSIDRVDQYKKGMNVHYSRGVYNHLFYLLATQDQWDVKQAFQVMIKANMDYWTPTSTFNEGGCGIINAANDLGYSVDDVKQVLSSVGINYQACSYD